jgi:hypothetical protein
MIAMSAAPQGAVVRRVGAVLIVLGLLDIGLAMYCIANEIAYSSSLNIFAVIAGVFLRREACARSGSFVRSRSFC